MLVGAGGWMCWSHVAAVRLQSQIDLIHNAKDPLLPGDFASRAVPSQQNAATYLIAATNALSTTVEPPSSSSTLYEDYPPFSPEWRRMAEQSTVANAQALLLAHRAAGCTQADWNGSTPPWNMLRALAHVLGDAAIQAHLEGDDALALQRIESLAHMASSLQSHRSIISYLVGMGVASLANERLAIILPDLRVEGDVSQTNVGLPGAHAATTDSLKRLLSELVEETRVHQDQRLTLLSERSDNYSSVSAMQTEATVLRPMFALEAVRVLAYWRMALAASEQPNYPAAAAQLAWLGVVPDGNFGLTRNAPLKAPRYSRIASSQLIFPEDRFLEQCYRYSAQRRTLAIALAIRLFRSRNGRWPASLDALVPDFLPEVPRDPLVAGSPPIALIVLRGALPDGSDRPMLRFGAAAGAQPSPPPPTPCFGWYRSQDDVQWRDLSRWYPPPPATEPADATQAQ